MHPEAVLDNTEPASAIDRLASPGLIRTSVVACFVLLLALAWVRNVNWDEFYFLAHVHTAMAGELDRPLQTFHVHLFSWLPGLGGNEMVQITWARLIMTALLALTCLCIFRIARSLLDHAEGSRGPALIAVLAFLTSGYTLAHGASFRADPMAAAFLMGATALIVVERLSILQIVAAALLVALAFLVTIKSVFYLPVLAGAMLLRFDDKREWIRPVLAFALASILAYGLYSWHLSGIQVAPDLGSAKNAKNAFRTTLLDAGLAPRWKETLLWAMLSIGPLVLALFGTLNTSNAKTRIALILFGLPLVLAIIFYRNAFAYFFPFIVPPMMVAVALGAAQMHFRFALGVVLSIMLASGAWQGMKSLSETSALQRDTVAEVHRLFPEPVPYIDANAMISSFPRDLFFMSTWGMAKYRANGEPVMADLIEKDAPPFLLAGRWNLHRVMTDPNAKTNPYLLLPEDIRTLRDTYAHYSGAIWLAGRELTLGRYPQVFEMSIPGRYRLDSSAPVRINGDLVNSGTVLELDDLVVIRGDKDTEVRLYWDTGVPLKPKALRQTSLYSGFWELSF